MSTLGRISPARRTIRGAQANLLASLLLRANYNHNLMKNGALPSQHPERDSDLTGARNAVAFPAAGGISSINIRAVFARDNYAHQYARGRHLNNPPSRRPPPRSRPFLRHSIEASM